MGDDELVENAKQDAWSISSSLSIAVLDGKKDNDIHPSKSLYFSMILSKGMASWYQSIAGARASCTSQWRASIAPEDSGTHLEISVWS